MNDSWNNLWPDVAAKLIAEPEQLEAFETKQEDIIETFLHSYKKEIVQAVIEAWDDYLEKDASASPEPAGQASDNQNPHLPPPQALPPMHTPLTGKITVRDGQIFLPNGKAQQPYAADCSPIIHQSNIYDIRFSGLERIGFGYDPVTSLISGIPVAAGEFPITMIYRRSGKQEYSSKRITVIINPDPRSLWIPIDTPRNIEYYKEDSAKQFMMIEGEHSSGKDMAAASCRGRSHAQEGKPRDDDFALHYSDEWYTMVVADGAGSAKYSRKGSEIACRTIVEECKEQLSLSREKFEQAITAFHENPSEENKKVAGDILYTILGMAAFNAVKAIKQEAQAKGYAVKDFATTLLAAICRKFSFGWFVGSFWVGDGGMGIYCRETQYLNVLGEPDGGEFAGQTRFLTMPEIMEANELYRRLRIDIVPEFTALILMTDGVTDPKFETDANLKRIERWNALWDDLGGKNEDNASVDFTDNNEASANQLLRWLDFWSKGNHDDRTIAILF